MCTFQTGTTGDRAPAWRRCALLHPTPMMVDPGTGVENASPNPLKRRFSLVGGKAAQQALEKRLLRHANPLVLKDVTKATQLHDLEA